MRVRSPLQAIVDVDAAARAAIDPTDLAAAYLAGGARFLQVRAKALGSRDLLALCDAVVRMARPFEADVIVNDRVDVARMSGAAGVHVGQDDLSPSDARLQLGPAAIVGFSTHSAAQVEAARSLPVTYIAVGPVFATATKVTGYEAIGLDFVARAAALAQECPLVAIGGITLDRAPAVLDAGAACVAVIGDLLASGPPATRVAAYLSALRQRP